MTKPFEETDEIALRRRAERELTGRTVSPPEIDDPQRLLHELQVHEIELEMQNEALRERAHELSVAKDAAEASSRAKARFLSNMSHELRTPMNGVLGLNRLLLSSDLDEKQRRYVELAIESGTALTNILSDILEFSKSEAGDIVLLDIAFDLRIVIDEVVALFSAAALEKSIDLSANIDETTQTRGIGDPNRLRQVLTNIVGNAIKFTHAGFVRITVGPHPGESTPAGVRIEVADSGIGMSPESMRALFTPFSQQDDSLARRFTGAGLGLALCDQLARAMGGEIGARSVLGRGSVLWLDLPLTFDKTSHPHAATDS